MPVYTHRDAIALIGYNFHIPYNMAFYSEKYESSETVGGNNAIYVTLVNDLGQIVFYYAQSNVEHEIYEWRVTGTMEEIELNGVTVYKQRDADGDWGRYTWQYDGINYCLFYSPTYNFTDEEYLTVILSMMD
jgi:hypothetical protein